MEQITNKKKAGQNDAVMGLSGVGVVIVLILIIVLALNYLNILALSQLFPSYFGFLPHMSSPGSKSGTANIPDKNTFLGSKDSIIANVKNSFGYDIIWMSDSDRVGRTVFYKNNDNYTLNPTYTGRLNGIGVIESGPTLKYYAGVLSEISDIPNSKDKYFVLADPQTNKLLVIARIIIEKRGNTLGTSLRIENLSYGTSRPASGLTFDDENLGLVSDFLKKDIIQKGDAVIIIPETDINNVKKEVKDDKNNPYSSVVVIRRFAGKTDIERELQKR